MARLTISDLEIERNDDPFEFEIGESVYTFSDPKGIQALSLISLETLSPTDQLRAILGQLADQFLSEPEVDGYLLDAVMNRYRKHYGLGTPPEAGASQRSSNATARRSKQTSRRGA